MSKKCLFLNFYDFDSYDGSPWAPKPDDLICNDHFVGKCKSKEPLSPSYIPTIFSKKNETREQQYSERSVNSGYNSVVIFSE